MRSLNIYAVVDYFTGAEIRFAFLEEAVAKLKEIINNTTLPLDSKIDILNLIESDYICFKNALDRGWLNGDYKIANFNCYNLISMGIEKRKINF